MNKKEALSPAFLNMVTILLMYGVILLFYMQEMIGRGPGNRGPDVWMNTLVESVGISTFTYVLPATIQNFQRMIRNSILLLVFDILYVLVYALYSPRPLLLNIFLCLCTIGLVLWTSLMIYGVSKPLTNGQAKEHKMESADAAWRGEAVSFRLPEDSGNDRIT